MRGENGVSRVAVDTGGTFTDLVVRGADGSLRAYKSPTTPADHSRGIANVLAKSDVRLSDLTLFTHGTTVALNALLEGRGAQAGLLTTAGFRDVLEIMRAQRPALYDLQADKPRPLIKRRHRLEIDERIAADGEILTPLDEDQVLDAGERLIAAGCECLAVAYLFSFKNPEHELRTRELLQDAFPDVLVSISSDMTREWREFERTSTTVVNSLCQPVIDRYVDRLERTLSDDGFAGTVQYMQSNGGLMTADETRQLPAKTVLSGPVGGVIGAELLGEATGEQNLLTLDIGGTSADMCLITGGHASLATDKRIERWPILFSTIDIHAVGAGGGSIGWIDDAGALQVGPRSAGADPGPVSYGRGGTEPTVTDAHLVLGNLDPDYFLGGELEIDRSAAVRAIEERIAVPLGVGVEEAAAGIIEVVNVKMYGALREVSIRRGHDAREFTLLAFGGAGGLHAAALARELGIGRAIVPTNPGVFSATGMLAANLKYDFAQTILESTSTVDPDALERAFEKLQATSAAKLDAAGVPEESRAVVRTADLRYGGQEFTISVPLDEGAITRESLARLADRFQGRHEDYFGFTTDDDVVMVNARASVQASVGGNAHAELPSNGASPGDGRKGTRSVFLTRGSAAAEVPIYERALLRRDQEIDGPAVIEEPQSTTLLGVADRARVDDYGNILIDTRGVE